MSNPKLSYEAKMLIKDYLFKKLLLIVTATSLLSFAIGFIVNDIARAEAYNKAYTEATQTIMQITNKATESAIKIKSLEEQFTELTKESKQVLSDATTLKEKISTTLVFQQSNNIISSITENLLSNTLFQNAVISKTASRISELENKTKYIIVDNSGNMIIKNEFKTLGIIWAYDFAMMDKKK